MNQENHTSAYRRFRIRSKSLMRDNKLLIIAELIIALLIMVVYLADFIPLSATPNRTLTTARLTTHAMLLPPANSATRFIR